MKYLPDIYKKNIFAINYDKLKKKDIKCLIFDLDNTLALIDSTKVESKVKELITKLKKDFLVVIVSNSSKKRVSLFGNDLGVDFYPSALKPTIRTLKKIKSKYKNSLSILDNEKIFSITLASKHHERMIIYKENTLETKNILYVLMFDFNFTAYNHGN